MNYILGWLVYLTVALVMVGIYYGYLEDLLPRALGTLLRVLLIVVLFTPWLVDTDNGYVPAPAFIAVLFSLLEHDRRAAAEALLPLLGASTLLVGLVAVFFRPDGGVEKLAEEMEEGEA